MERSIWKRRVVVQVCLMALLVALGLGTRAAVQRASAQGRSAAVQAPLFEIDPLWPKPLPNHWVLGSLGGIGVDEQDHVWILNRGSRTLAANETYEGHRVQRFIYKGLGPVTKKYQGVLWPSSSK